MGIRVDRSGMGTELKSLAELIRRRNECDAQIAHIIGRPAFHGHLAEFIASQIFRIRLEKSANHKGFDGRILDGPFALKKVNIKYSAVRDNTLNINPLALPDLYLALTGPRKPAESSRKKTRPFCIAAVYLFDAIPLYESLKTRGVKIGTATSVANQYWDDAEIYPRKLSPSYQLSSEQRSRLGLFAL